MLNEIEETGLIEHAARMGELLFGQLRVNAAENPSYIKEVRGLGLMVGVEYVEDSLGPRMSYHLAQHGVLAIYSGNQPSVMRLMPSLVIEEPEVDYLVKAFRAALADLQGGQGPSESPARAKRRPVRNQA